VPETKSGNVGSASHSGGRQVARDSHFVYDYIRRRVPMPVISYMAVADAAFDQPAGDSASKKALDLLKDAVEPAVIAEEELASTHMEALIKDALAKVNQGLLPAADAQVAPEATCVSLSLVIADRKQAYIGHIGTNRVYLLHNERLYDLTPSGAIAESPPVSQQSPTLFTVPVEAGPAPVEQPAAPQAVTGDYLGQASDARMGYNEVEILPGDMVILCSDGFWKTVSEEEMVENLLSAISVQRSASQLTRLAFSRASDDNATFVVWQYVLPGATKVATVRESRSHARRERAAETLLVTLLALVLVGIFAVGFAFGWKITDAFRKPQKEASRSAKTIVKEKPGAKESAESAPVQEEAPAQARQTVIVDGKGVRIRTTAAANGDVVGMLQDGQQLIVLGEANGTDGKLWIKVRGTVRSGGKDIEAEGFVREDFLQREPAQSAPAASNPSP